MGYEQMNQMTMTTTAMMKNYNKKGLINTPQKKMTRRSVSAIDGGAAATAKEGDRRQNIKTLDLSGMSLASLSASSINLASISKLDLSNNNIQVFNKYIEMKHLFIYLMEIAIFSH